MKTGLEGADVVMMLRIQRERMHGEFDFSQQTQDYITNFGLTHAKLEASAKPDVIVMHPGPINRGIEITSELADDPTFSVIREQVEMGVAIRMAAMDLLLSAQGK